MMAAKIVAALEQLVQTTSETSNAFHIGRCPRERISSSRSPSVKKLLSAILMDLATQAAHTPAAVVVVIIM